MLRINFRFATIVVSSICLPILGVAQSTTGVTLVRQTLQAQVGTASLPADLTMVGQITDKSGTRPLRIQIKGRDKARYEVGTGNQTIVSILNGRSSWTGSATSLKAVPEHAAVHRPAEIPFLDVIVEVDNARFKAKDLGLDRVGVANLRHVAARLSDPTPQQRFLNRPLDEVVDLFIDPGTNLVVRSQRLLTADDSMDFRVPLVRNFSDYRVVSGLVIPFRIATTVGTPNSGMYQYTWVFQSVVVNQGIADSVFQPR